MTECECQARKEGREKKRMKKAIERMDVTKGRGGSKQEWRGGREVVKSVKEQREGTTVRPSPLGTMSNGQLQLTIDNKSGLFGTHGGRYL